MRAVGAYSEVDALAVAELVVGMDRGDGHSLGRAEVYEGLVAERFDDLDDRREAVGIAGIGQYEVLGADAERLGLLRVRRRGLQWNADAAGSRIAELGALTAAHDGAGEEVHRRRSHEA